MGPEAVDVDSAFACFVEAVVCEVGARKNKRTAVRAPPAGAMTSSGVITATRIRSTSSPTALCSGSISPKGGNLRLFMLTSTASLLARRRGHDSRLRA
ncbi:MAG: hypothetical protein GKR86_12680 [Ilumatobacter sp.]|nr:hypothetical protein [Ilumatobacter sp.]